MVWEQHIWASLTCFIRRMIIIRIVVVFVVAASTQRFFSRFTVALSLYSPLKSSTPFTRALPRRRYHVDVPPSFRQLHIKLYFVQYLKESGWVYACVGKYIILYTVCLCMCVCTRNDRRVKSCTLIIVSIVIYIPGDYVILVIIIIKCIFFS